MLLAAALVNGLNEVYPGYHLELAPNYLQPHVQGIPGECWIVRTATIDKWWFAVIEGKVYQLSSDQRHVLPWPRYDLNDPKEFFAALEGADLNAGWWLSDYGSKHAKGEYKQIGIEEVT